MTDPHLLGFEAAVQRIRAAGMRMTRPREVLLRLVLESAGPFSTKMLHARALEAGLAIHLTTVHRNLSDFVAIGLIDELPGDENRLFALHRDQESGAHVFCIDCHLVVVLAEAGTVGLESNPALSEALARQGFDTASVRLMLAAHCTSLHEESCGRPHAFPER